MKHDSENRRRRSIRLPEYDYTSPGHFRLSGEIRVTQAEKTVEEAL